MSAVFGLLEIAVSILLFVSPESVVETVDVNARGVDYIIEMWAGRQFALGVIFAFATFKRSAPMLTVAYVFFLAMFVSDFVVGLLQKDNGLITSALIMCAVSSAMIVVLNKKK